MLTKAAWSPHVFSSLFFLSSSLPLPLFFRLIPWSIGAPCTHLSARVFKTRTGRHSASSLLWETGRAPVASVKRANFLSRSFIGSLGKPRNISLFLSFIFLSSTVFPYLSLNQSPMLFLLRVSLDPAGAGPRNRRFTAAAPRAAKTPNSMPDKCIPTKEIIQQWE